MSRNLAVLVFSAVSLLAGQAFAQSQPYEQVEETKTWKVDVGGGFVRGFSATGDNSKDMNWTFWGSASYKDVVYANGLDGIGWNAINHDDFRAGVQLRPRFAAGDLDGFDNRPELGADATLYAFKRLPGNVVVGGRISQDVTGDDAGMTWNAQIGHQRITPVGLLQVMAYGRGGDADRLNRYFGVTAEEAVSSGYRAFEGDGGLSGLGVSALLAVPVGPRYGVGAFVNYEEYMGDARHSPLLEEPHIWRAGIIGVARFNGM